MLFGEHAVLRGGHAIAAAIDCRLSVTITPRSDTMIDVCSAFGTVTATLDNPCLGTNLRFVEGVFRLLNGRLPSGVHVAISSAIDPTVGLASSAAVTVALMAALTTWIRGSYDNQALLRDCCTVIRNVQGYGSGADAAASIYGGVISYRADEIAVSPLLSELPLVFLYSGKKTPTPEVIRCVRRWEQQQPKVYQALFSALNDVTSAAIDALVARDETTVGRLMNHAHGLMEALGVGTPELSALCWALRSAPTIYGAKISGSGLGDAVVGLGAFPEAGIGKRLPSAVATTGVEVCVCPP